MRILFIFLLVIVGCSEPNFKPSGNMGTAEPYYMSIEKVDCEYCRGMKCVFFKIDEEGRKICQECYVTKYK